MGTISVAQVDPRVASFLEKPRKMLINGNWVDAVSGKTFPSYDPSTGEVLANVAEGDRADIDLAVKAARKAFDSGPWRKMSASERGRLIWKLADLIEAHAEEFAYLESLDNGKPLTVARAADVPLAVDLFRYMAGWATKIEGNTIPLSVPYTPGAKYFSSLYAGRKIFQLHAARTGRRSRADYSLEFSAADGRLEARAGTGQRVHSGAETCRADAIVGFETRRDDHRSWIPGGRGQHRSRIRRNCRRCFGCTRQRG